MSRFPNGTMPFELRFSTYGGQVSASAFWTLGLRNHMIRHYGDCELRRRWVSACIERALATRNGSLTESLLWTLGAGIRSEPRLVELALQLADTYPPVRKPLQKFYAEPSQTNA